MRSGTFAFARLSGLVSSLVAGGLVAGLLAQRAPEYRQLVEQYRRGDIDAAVAAASALTADDVRKQVDRLIAAERKHGRLVQAALMLHTEVLLAAARQGSPGRGHHVWASDLLRAAIESPPRQPDDDEFLRGWYLLVIADAQGRLVLPTAKLLSDSARRRLGDDPELLLAIGSLNELAWTLEHDDDTVLGVAGDLKTAEASYKAALAGNPGLVEAQVRLGRVLTLKGDPDAALQVLSTVGADKDRGFFYLARLFEGAALEQRSDPARAVLSYRAAIDAMPAGHSARIALAHLHHTGGRRPIAADAVRQLSSGVLRADDQSDPWFWYIRGTGWRVPGYLEWLRKRVTE